ncbi:hypothetical protein GCM10020000_78360 [Streptomyces olivoverticillatus]
MAVHVRPVAQQPYGRERVLGEQPEIPVERGVLDGSLVVDEGGDPGPGEGLGLLPVFLPRPGPRAAEKHDAGARRVRRAVRQDRPVEDETAAAPEGDLLVDEVVAGRPRCGMRQEKRDGRRPYQGCQHAYEWFA